MSEMEGEREATERDLGEEILFGPCAHYVFGAHSGNAIGPEGSKALAVPLEQLTARQKLNLRHEAERKREKKRWCPLLHEDREIGR